MPHADKGHPPLARFRRRIHIIGQEQKRRFGRAEPGHHPPRSPQSRPEPLSLEGRKVMLTAAVLVTLVAIAAAAAASAAPAPRPVRVRATDRRG
jgi:hypothetical protein